MEYLDLKNGNKHHRGGFKMSCECGALLTIIYLMLIGIALKAWQLFIKKS